MFFMTPMSLGLTRYSRAGGIPSWVTPGPDGTLPTDLADYAGNRGWYDGRSYGSIAAYLAGASGTFSRGSDATYFGDDGILRNAGPNVLRLDHDPGAGKALGARLEGARTNLLPYPNDFSKWTAGGYAGNVLSAAIPGPFGGFADKITEGSTQVDKHGRRISASGLLENAPNRMVFWAKAAERQMAAAWSFANNTSLSFFMLSGDGLAEKETITSNDPRIVALPGGWYECSLDAVTNAGQTTKTVHIGPRVFATGAAWQGDGVSGIYVQHAQLEAAPFNSSRILGGQNPTSRLADSLTFARAAPPEGTVVIEGRTPLGTGGNQVLWQWDDGADANRYRLVRVNDGNLRAIMTVTGVDVVNLDLGPVANDADLKVVPSWRSGQFAASLNGAAAVVDTAYTGPMPVVSTVRCGSGATSGDEWFGTIAHLGLFDKAYSPAQIQEMSA